MYMFLDWQ